MKLIYEKSRPGRRGIGVPRPDLPVPEVPGELARKEAPRLPELAEPEVLRHFTELSTRNFGIDTGFYPLGSCTMKYNPRINERLVGLPGIRGSASAREDDAAQGALELEWHLQEILLEVTGLDAVSLQPAAGSQGELTGLMLFHAYFRDQGEDDQRRKIVIPDTAHGTNPASVTMAGLRADAGQDRRTRQHRCRGPARQGRRPTPPASCSPTRRRSACSTRTSRRSATSFTRRRRAHVLRRRQPERGPAASRAPATWASTSMHINLHKTFSHAARRRRPRRGPVAVSRQPRAVPAAPPVDRQGRPTFRLDYDRPKSIGRVRAFNGNFGMLVRALHVHALDGSDGLRAHRARSRC